MSGDERGPPLRPTQRRSTRPPPLPRDPARGEAAPAGLLASSAALPVGAGADLEAWSSGLTAGAVGRDAAGLGYRLVAPLDRGGMGELFVAELLPPADRPDARPPARHAVVKRLLPDLTEDRDYVAMFEAEARVMARLDHPSVVAVYGLPVIEGAHCLALEYVDGRSAHQWVSRARRLRRHSPPPLVAYVGLRVAEALDHVHRARDDAGRPLELVHRDVSPGNVLLGFDGRVKLTDFGIAKSRISAVSTTVGIVKGKARYLAPEQIRGLAATPRSDVFSLATVLVELLTSEPLFERGAIPKTLFSIVHGERPPMRELLPRGAAPLAEVLEAALTPSPEDRLPDARTFAEWLADARRDLGPPVDADALGAHLRGIFAGTKGPLGRRRQRPASEPASSGRGAEPLDPAAFGSAPSASASDELPPVPPSAPQEVDRALSTLALIQARSAGPRVPPDEARTTLALPPRRSRWSRRLKGFPGGLLAGLGAGVAAGALWAGPWPPRTPSALGTPSPPEPALPEVVAPRGARVTVDGEPTRERVPVRAPLTPGPHVVTVAGRRGRRTFELIVQPGERIRVADGVTRRPAAAAERPAASDAP